jgi:hypothetical protein
MSVAALDKILSTAHDIRSCLRGYVPSRILARPSLPALPPQRDFVLVEPQSLTDALVNKGVDNAAAERLSAAYLQAARKQKALCEASYTRMAVAYSQLGDEGRSKFTELAGLMQTMLTSRYATMLGSWTDQIVNYYAPRMILSRTNSMDTQKENRRLFNQVSEFVLLAVIALSGYTGCFTSIGGSF